MNTAKIAIAALMLGIIAAAPCTAIAQTTPTPVWLAALEAKASNGDIGSGPSGIWKGDVAVLEAKANKGDVDAECVLGDRYDRGDAINGITPDRVVAARWWRKAAEQGNPDAQRELGGFYDRGDAIDGIMPDPAKAAKWLRKAAEQGIGSAQEALESRYSTGKGVTKSEEEWYFWLNVAAKSGSKADADSLDEFTHHPPFDLTPEQISRAQKRASEWKPTPNPAYLASLQAKAARGDNRAQYQLGILYYLGGTGVTQNYEEAFFLLHVAAKGGVYKAVDSFNVLEPVFERHLTPEQISGIKKLASEWKPVPFSRPPPKVAAKAGSARRCPQPPRLRRRLAMIDHAATGVVTFGAITPPECPVTIPAGTTMQTADLIQYETTADVVLAAGRRSVNAPVQALVAGSASNVHAGQLNQLTTVIPGVDTVTNRASINFQPLAGRKSRVVAGTGGPYVESPSGGRPACPAGTGSTPILSGPTIATGRVEGLPGGGSTEMDLRLRPQSTGILIGEIVIHRASFNATSINGIACGDHVDFHAAYGAETANFHGQRTGDRLSGTFKLTPSGAHGTWSVATPP